MELRGLLLSLIGVNLAISAFGAPAPTKALFRRQNTGGNLTSPVDDPFYDPPTGFESTELGSILRARALGLDSLPYFIQFSNIVRGAYQFLYHTSDNFNQSTAAVTTLIVPQDADPSKLVSYQVAEDSAFIECAPSHTLRNSSINPDYTASEVMFMGIYLSKGYYVNVPDYEGPESAFTAGYMAGHAVLDSLRSVLSTQNSTGLQNDSRIGLVGYSGGALASGWAAQLGNSYAPELNIVGTAIGGSPVDINATVTATNEGPFVGLVPAGLMGLSRIHDDFAQYFSNITIPEKLPELEAVYGQCNDANMIQFANQDIGDYFTIPNYLDSEIVDNVMEYNRMGQIGAPNSSNALYIYHAVQDEIVPFDPAQQMVEAWCDEGATIEFVQDSANNHQTLSLFGIPYAVQFIVDRLEGQPIEPGCSTRDSALTSLNSTAQEIIGEPIFQLLNLSSSAVSAQLPGAEQDGHDGDEDEEDDVNSSSVLKFNSLGLLVAVFIITFNFT